MSNLVVRLDHLDRSHLATVGAKAAHLGELTRLAGTNVPPGFCVTTEAYRRVVSTAPSIAALADRLGATAPDDVDTVAATSADLRTTIEHIAIPPDVVAAISHHVGELGEGRTCAVRSSATAEDAPTASFAGQHDTYLGVVGIDAILDHVRRCWASQFTARAVDYRRRHHIGHRDAEMAVIVQQMVDADVSGVMFTADPVTHDRTVVTIDAAAGLGDRLVSGLVAPDTFEIRDDRVIASTTAGGSDHALLPHDVAVDLARLARRIEAHLGGPQDIEWCLADGVIHVVQSRPITTLFPIPTVTDGRSHVWVSVGHQQMMTDAMRPLGLSFWQLTAARSMDEAGGRLFVDITDALANPTTRAAQLSMLERSDPLVRDALDTVLARDGFVPTVPDAAPVVAAPARGVPPVIETDPAIVAELVATDQAAIAGLRADLAGTVGDERYELIVDDIARLKRTLFDPRSLQAIVAGMDATWWLNEHLEEWLGETGIADRLAQSAPHNVTSEMGLALLDVADAIRPHPDAVAVLRRTDGDDDVLDRLDAVDGGPAARAAIAAFLDRYGMRCVGEIDITRPRWRERPSALVPLLLADIDRFEPGEAERRREAGRAQAQRTEADVLRRLRALPDGHDAARRTEEVIARLRAFVGYREYPKYSWMCRYDVYKQAILDDARRLVDAGVIDDVADVFFLRFEELRDVARTHELDRDLVRRRRAEFEAFRSLTPPRVMTSDGERLDGTHRRDDLPEGALAGLPVSAGIVEGRARVVVDVADARLEPGDILVTVHTDPSWTPVFVTAAGLVTEVGAVMSHGSVVAREYGLPAVVGVHHATRLIEDGRRIRVDGTRGSVVALSDDR